MNILIIGYGRHGKDTVAEILRDHYGMLFESSSAFAADKAVMPIFYDPKANEAFLNWVARNEGEEALEVRRQEILDVVLAGNYNNSVDAFTDRSNHRGLWYDALRAYNDPDRTKLASGILQHSNIYVGMRSKRELFACQVARVFDLVIWVDASDRLPPEDKDSCTVEPWMADLVLDNNGSLDDLHFAVEQFAKSWLHLDVAA